MLIFSEGFDRFHPSALDAKFDIVSISNASSDDIPIKRSLSDGHKLLSIVSGYDVNGKPNARKDGRALLFNGGKSQYTTLSLALSFRRSRTIFFGFAVKSYKAFALNITFGTKSSPCSGLFSDIHDVAAPTSTKIGYSSLFYMLNRHFGPHATISRGVAYKTVNPDTYYPGYNRSSCYNKIIGAAGGSTVGTLRLNVSSNRLYGQYEFPTPATPIPIEVVTSKSLLNGEFRYYQFGITIHGNESDPPTAWLESRIGGRNFDSGRVDNIRTVLLGSASGYYFDSMAISFANTTAYNNIYLDDMYVCNEEGSNNTFLGPVYVKSLTPEDNGEHNDAELFVGGQSKPLAVGPDLAGFDSMPTPQPSPETGFVPWANPLDEQLRFHYEGARQSFQFSNTNIGVSKPKVFGVGFYTFARAKHVGARTSSLRPFIYLPGIGYHDVPQCHFPVPGTGWLGFTRYIDNPDLYTLAPGEQSSFFSVDALAASEYGLALERFTGKSEDFSGHTTRIKLVLDDVVVENLGIFDLCHRFFEESAVSQLSVLDMTENELVWAFYDLLEMTDSSSCTKSFYAWVPDAIIMGISTPDSEAHAKTYADFSELTQFDVALATGSTAAFDEWVTDKPVEQVTSFASISDLSTPSFNLVTGSSLDFSSTLSDTFEDVVEGLSFYVGDCFPGHFTVDELLVVFPSPPVAGLILFTEDGIGLVTEDYDGHLVESVNSSAHFSCIVLTQHWRHEMLFGVCISSQQIAPVEQPGDDGDRVGWIDSQMHGGEYIGW